MNADLPEMAGHPVGDKASRQHYIGRTVWFTVPGTWLAIAGVYTVLPELAGMQEPAARLLLAFRWLLVASLPYAAVCIWIATARFLEGSHNPLAGAESESLKIHCRAMQNTLEHLVWFAVSLLALATWLTPEEARVIPVLCTAFAIARVVYWWGYLRSGTLGRAPGVQITFTLNIALLATALMRFASDFGA